MHGRHRSWSVPGIAGSMAPPWQTWQRQVNALVDVRLRYDRHGHPSADRPMESRLLVSSVRRRRLAATALAATAILTLTACGDARGFNSQTSQQYQAGVGANHHGKIEVLNALFVANDDTSATLSAGIVNNSGSDQSLSAVTVTSMSGDEVPVRSTRIPLPQYGLTTLGGEADATGIRVPDGARAGYYLKVTLSFTDAAPITIEAPVVARTEIYDTVPG